MSFFISPAMAQEVHKSIRSILTEKFAQKETLKVPILYGGSMKPENAQSLLEQDDIDGGLIGGASLDIKSFTTLIEKTLELSKSFEGSPL